MKREFYDKYTYYHIDRIIESEEDLIYPRMQLERVSSYPYRDFESAKEGMDIFSNSIPNLKGKLRILCEETMVYIIDPE